MTPLEVTNFQEDVIEASRARPVLVDFWAPWCGPCRVLGPILERLSREQQGRWKLVKINSDEHPDLSMQYGIRGIPAVKLFVDGEVVDEFVGALPEYQVRQWLDRALPSEGKRRLEQARALLDAGQLEAASALLQRALEEEPTSAEIKVLLGRALVFDDPVRAARLVEEEDLAEPALMPIREAIQALAQRMQASERPDLLPDEDGKETYLAALEALNRRDLDTALATFIKVLQQNRYYDDDGVRKVGVALFTLLGPQHPLTRKHRRTFDMWLY